MTTRITRRQLLVGAGRLGVSYAVFEAALKGFGLIEQRQTWDLAAEPNEAFFARNARRIATLELGGSFAPEQWPLDGAGHAEALQGLDIAVRELGLRKMRLGFRWSRVHRENGAPDLSAYRDFVDYCFANGVEVCLNPGPIRTFRWPEEHVPREVLAALPSVPAKGATITPDMPLARRSLQYLDDVMGTLHREYSASDLAAVRMVQAENEPYYPLGEHEWILGKEYLEAVSLRLHAAFPDADLLITSAGRLNMNVVRDVLFRLQLSDESLRGKLVSGFDFHYRTPNRDSYPIARHFDQITYARPFVAGTNDNILDSRQAGYRIEVTEGQMEPYGHFQQPGNSATDLRYMLQRVFDHVLDPREPALVRLWGVEELVKKMLHGTLTEEHHQIIDLIQRVNGRPHQEEVLAP